MMVRSVLEGGRALSPHYSSFGRFRILRAKDDGINNAKTPSCVSAGRIELLVSDM